MLQAYTVFQEFSVSISPIHRLFGVRSQNSSSQVQYLAQATEHHSILLWPEKIVLSGLRKEDAGTIVPFLLNEELIDCDSLRTQLSKELPHCHVSDESFPAFMVICSVSKYMSYTMASQLLGWFHSCLLEENVTPNGLYMSTELGEHRNSTNILVLPYEDCFEYLGQEKVANLTKKYSQLHRHTTEIR